MSMSLLGRLEPIPGYKFKVFIYGISMGFTRITNLENSIETEALQEGGVNDRVYSLVRPVSVERTLVLEGGVTANPVDQLIQSQLFHLGRRIYTDVIITVHDRNGSVGKMFIVHGAVVKKISFDGFDAMSGQPMIARYELTYEAMEVGNAVPAIL